MGGGGTAPRKASGEVDAGAPHLTGVGVAAPVGERRREGQIGIEDEVVHVVVAGRLAGLGHARLEGVQAEGLVPALDARA